MFRTMLRTRLDQLRKQDGGFTLIELLIVIVVLGVLSAIVVFGLATFRTDATNAACLAAQKTVEVAADAWHAKATNPATGDVAIGSLIGGGYLKAGTTMPTGCALPAGVTA